MACSSKSFSVLGRCSVEPMYKVVFILILATFTCAISESTPVFGRTVPFQVIGAGVGRTGTTSLRFALQMLGIAPVHDWPSFQSPLSPTDAWIREIELKAASQAGNHNASFVSSNHWDELLIDYAAIVDSPADLFALELAETYQSSKVILTVRDSTDEWYESYRTTIQAYGARRHKSFGMRAIKTLDWLTGYQSKEVQIRNALERAELAKGGYSPDSDAKSLESYHKARYEAHNEKIRRSIDPDRLLVFNVKEGWEPLCTFLGKDVPSLPFPRINTAMQFQHFVDQDVESDIERMKVLVQRALLGLVAIAGATYLVQRYLL